MLTGNNTFDLVVNRIDPRQLGQHADPVQAGFRRIYKMFDYADIIRCSQAAAQVCVIGETNVN